MILLIHFIFGMGELYPTKGGTKIIVNIDDILYYGRYYRDENVADSDWWFCRLDDQIYDTYDLYNKFGYETKQQIIDSKNYICLFKTDIIEKKKEFLAKRGISKYSHLSDSMFDMQFNKFIDEYSLHTQWFEFEYSILKRDAMEWCCINHIL